MGRFEATRQYKKSYYICTYDLICDYDYKSINYEINTKIGIQKWKGSFALIRYLGPMFVSFWKLLLNDLIEENIEFVLPNSKHFNGEFTICLERFGRQFEDKSSYSIVLRYTNRFSNEKRAKKGSARWNYDLDSFQSVKPIIYIISTDKAHKKRLFEIDQTRGIKVGKTKTLHDYIDILYEKYDKLPKSEVLKFLQHGLISYERAVAKGQVVFISDKTFFMKTYNYRIKYGSYLRFLMALAKKSTFMFHKLNIIWDGYYYFNLEKEFYDSVKDDIAAGKVVNYTQGRLYRDKVSALFSQKPYAIMRIRCVDFDTNPYKLLGKTDKAKLYRIIDNIDYKQYYKDVIKESESLIFYRERYKSRYLENTAILREFRDKFAKKVKNWYMINDLYARYRFGLQDGKNYLRRYKRARRNRYISKE